MDTLSRLVTDLYNIDANKLSNHELIEYLEGFNKRLELSTEFQNSDDNTHAFIQNKFNELSQKVIQHDDTHDCSECNTLFTADGAENDDSSYEDYLPSLEEVSEWRDAIVSQIEHLDNQDTLLEEKDQEIQEIKAKRDEFLYTVGRDMKVQYERANNIAKLATTLLDLSLKNLESIHTINDALSAYRAEINESYPEPFKHIQDRLLNKHSEGNSK